jgi:hypothetical protein
MSVGSRKFTKLSDKSGAQVARIETTVNQESKVRVMASIRSIDKKMITTRKDNKEIFLVEGQLITPDNTKGYFSTFLPAYVGESKINTPLGPAVSGHPMQMTHGMTPATFLVQYF